MPSDGPDLDLARRRVVRADGREERLTTLEAKLLAHLRDNAHRVVDREELLREVWGYAPGIVSRAVDHTVRRVRAKVEVDPADPEHLLTEYGGGYRWMASGAPVEATPPPTGVHRRYVLGSRVLDLDRAQVEAPDGGHPLTAAELRLLDRLVRAAGASVDRDALQRAVWGGVHGRALENAVYRLRRKLEPDPATPVHLLTTPDGYRLEPGAPVLPGPPRRLPAELDARFGRDDDVRAVERALSTGACVTVTGPGGIGKSRLALAVGRAWEAGGGRVVAAELEELAAGDDVVLAVARALSVPLSGTQDPADQVEAALGAGPAALVWLDGAERVVEALAGPLARWRGQVPGCRFLVTSRRPLGVAGEVRYPLGPLPPAAARDLFLDRASRPPDPDDPALAALLEGLDGSPLAIELAAARTEVLAVDELVARLHAQLSLLSGGGPDRPARHRSLRACLAVSFELCGPPEQEALRQLTAFAGRFRAADAERVLDLDGAWPVDAVQALADAGLLATDAGGGLRMPAPVRQALPPPPAGARGRHAGFVADEARRALAAVDGPEELSAFGRLAALREELEVVALHADQAEHSVAAALALWVTTSLGGPYPSAGPALDAAAARAPGDPEVTLARAELLLATGRARDAVACAAGLDPDRLPTARLAVRCLRLRAAATARLGPSDRGASDRALATGRASQDPATLAWGLVAATEHRVEERDTVALLGEALDHALVAGGTRLEATVRRFYGFTLARHGEPERGRAELRRARALALAAGDRWLAAQILLNALHVGGWFGFDSAQADLEAARAEMAALGSRAGEAKARGLLAAHHAAAGDRDRAEATYREALALARRWGVDREAVEIQKLLGSLLVDRGRPAEGEVVLREAMSALGALGLTAQAHSTAANLGRALRRQGRHAEARPLYEAALDWFRAQGLARDEAQVLHVLGRLHAELGEEEAAIERWRLGLTRAVGAPHTEAELLASLAFALRRRGDPEAAALAAAATERFVAAGDDTRARALREAFAAHSPPAAS